MQRDKRLAEIEFLGNRRVGLTGSLLLEFSILRMGRRIDEVSLSSNSRLAQMHSIAQRWTKCWITPLI